MKKLSKILAAHVCAIAALACPLANASLVSHDAGSFLDTDTGFLWRTLAQYDNLTYQQAVAALPSGYHVATEAELATLTAAAPGKQDFYGEAATLGAAFDPDNPMIWGFYGDGTRYLWRTDWEDFWTSSAANDSGWANANVGKVPAGAKDPYLSVFAVNTAGVPANVPEPATLALVGLGLAGLARCRRSGSGQA